MSNVTEHEPRYATPAGLPFVVGVMADLRGRDRDERRPRFADRRFIDLTIDNLDEVLARLSPELDLRLKDLEDGDAEMAVSLRFQCMADFDDAALERQLSCITERSIEANERLLSSIRCHPQLQALEATWRGVDYLLREALPDREVRVKVFDASKREVLKDLEKAVEFDQSGVFRSVFSREMGTPGGYPFGCLVADYRFSDDRWDMRALGDLAKVAAAAAVPLFTAIDRGFLRLRHWQDLDVAFEPAWCMGARPHAPLRSLAEQPDAQYLYLTLPRFQPRDDAVAGRCCWINAAYALAVCAIDGFRKDRWATAPSASSGWTLGAASGEKGGVALAEYRFTPSVAEHLAGMGLVPIRDESMPTFGSPRPFGTSPAPFDLATLLRSCRVAHHAHCLSRDLYGSTVGAAYDAALVARLSELLSRQSLQHVARLPMRLNINVFGDAHRYLALELAALSESDTEAMASTRIRIVEPPKPAVRPLATVVVIADLGGHKAKSKRRSYYLDADNVGFVIERLEPRLRITVPDVMRGEGDLAVELEFRCEHDFTPEGIASQVPLLAGLLEQRDRIVDLAFAIDTEQDRSRWCLAMAGRANGLDVMAAWLEAAHVAGQAPVSNAVLADLTQGWLENLTERFDAAALPGFVDALWDLARHYPEGEPVPTRWNDLVRAVLQALDARVSAQLSLILRDPGYRRLAGTWSALAQLARSLPDDRTLELRVMNLTREALIDQGSDYEPGKTPADGSDRFWTELFNDAFYGPYAAIVVDQTLSTEPGDVAALQSLRALGRELETTVWVGAAADWAGRDTWEEVAEHGPAWDTVSAQLSWDSNDANAKLCPGHLLRPLPHVALNDPSRYSYSDTAALSAAPWATPGFAAAEAIMRNIEWGKLDQEQGPRSMSVSIACAASDDMLDPARLGDRLAPGKDRTVLTTLSSRPTEVRIGIRAPEAALRWYESQFA
ncbi:MAG: type VI secretion system contractile sheath large subunit [Gammaproteobacteria bacterium]|nr:type VI secretion system contractile sheath large subunit [Gammaproteobacteria bacterium]